LSASVLAFRTGLTLVSLYGYLFLRPLGFLLILLALSDNVEAFFILSVLLIFLPVITTGSA